MITTFYEGGSWMNNFKELLYYMIGRVPADLHENELKGKKLLHISDTPSSFFDELSRLISILKPDYIVHTGDLVDNIKLEIFPGSIWRYERDVAKLIKILEQSGAEELYLAIGNHDDLQTVRRLCQRSHIITTSETVDIEGLEFTIAHDPAEIIKKPSAYNLFGHNLTQKSGFSDGRLYLNGITSINLIDLDSKNHYSYPYPAGTDDNRLGRGKIGI
jgi:predicted MPP superfamily phosphohydrolase